jgi:hypothetical protein
MAIQQSLLALGQKRNIVFLSGLKVIDFKVPFFKKVISISFMGSIKLNKYQINISEMPTFIHR